MDVTLVGWVDHHRRRGFGAKKLMVIIGLEIKHPEDYGRGPMRLVPDASGERLMASVRKTTLRCWAPSCMRIARVVIIARQRLAMPTTHDLECVF